MALPEQSQKYLPIFPLSILSLPCKPFLLVAAQLRKEISATPLPPVRRWRPESSPQRIPGLNKPRDFCCSSYILPFRYFKMFIAFLRTLSNGFMSSCFHLRMPCIVPWWMTYFDFNINSVKINSQLFLQPTQSANIKLGKSGHRWCWYILAEIKLYTLNHILSLRNSHISFSCIWYHRMVWVGLSRWTSFKTCAMGRDTSH